MKVQITVDEEMWKKAKARAALNGVTLGELVGEALGLAVKSIKIQGDKFPETVTTEFSVPKKEIVKETGSCQHRWGVRNGKSQCLLCGVKP